VRQIPDFEGELDLDTVKNTIRLGSIVKEKEEIKFPVGASMSRDEPAMLVAKYGEQGGLTFGIANEVKIGIRSHCLEDPPLSDKWCILGHKGVGSLKQPFSQIGDSVSCAFGTQGRVAGITTGGKEQSQDKEGKFDITYTTPIEWLS
jgi:hypothetical protein